MNYVYSAFYYGHTVFESNRYIDFKEGSEVKTATLALGSYTLEEYANEIARALSWFSANQYLCQVDRKNRTIKIESTANFELLLLTGEHSESAFTSLAGFQKLDYSGAKTYEGPLPSGKAFCPQCPINQYQSFENWRGASDASVNVSASGRSTVISFGEVSRMRLNIHAITDKPLLSNLAIKNNQAAISECLEFMSYITTKKPIEFMYDISQANDFDKCTLESTTESKEGVGFELYEGLGKGLRGVYETKTLTFRKVS